jgi:putative nucleotidyltransferase with HDIG domain
MNKLDFSQAKVLFVDDEQGNLRVFKMSFRRDFQVLTASSGAEALELFKEHRVAVVLTDQRMPTMTGIELLKIVRQRYPLTIRVLITGYADLQVVIDAINSGEVYRYCRKPWNYAELRNTIRSCIETHLLQSRTEDLLRDLQSMFLGSISALARAIDARDRYTHNHSQRVAQFSVMLAKEYGLSEDEVQEVNLASLLHDVGKIGIPEVILNKMGMLTDEEWRKMREHPLIGEEILSSIAQLDRVRKFMRHHHERYDGRGYPDQLAGEEIPFVSRIIAIADAFDAMITDRPYRGRLALEDALEEVQRNMGSQFDPELASLFVKLVRDSGVQDPLQFAAA